VAESYDAGLAGSALFAADLRFVEHYCPPPGKLIDLGCGTGRLLVALAKKDLEVVGVDLSMPMLEAAAAKARADGVRVRLLQANIVELGGIADETFDYAACLFSTLGMIRGQEPRRRVVEHAFRVLRPGGRFVLHVHNRWFNIYDRAGRSWLLRDLLRAALGREDVGDRVMPPHRGLAGLTLHHFTRSEAMRLLKSVGFEIAAVQPVGLEADGSLRWAWWWTAARAYGYLLTAVKPSRAAGT
jgi:SAM-dependent methyltransferase